MVTVTTTVGFWSAISECKKIIVSPLVTFQVEGSNNPWKNNLASLLSKILRNHQGETSGQPWFWQKKKANFEISPFCHDKTNSLLIILNSRLCQLSFHAYYRPKMKNFKLLILIVRNYIKEWDLAILKYFWLLLETLNWSSNTFAVQCGSRQGLELCKFSIKV